MTASIGKRGNVHPLHMDCWLANCSGHSPEQFLEQADVLDPAGGTDWLSATKPVRRRLGRGGLADAAEAVVERLQVTPPG